MYLVREIYLNHGVHALFIYVDVITHRIVGNAEILYCEKLNEILHSLWSSRDEHGYVHNDTMSRFLNNTLKALKWI